MEATDENQSRSLVPSTDSSWKCDASQGACKHDADGSTVKLGTAPTPSWDEQRKQAFIEFQGGDTCSTGAVTTTRVYFECPRNAIGPAPIWSYADGVRVARVW